MKWKLLPSALKLTYFISMARSHKTQALATNWQSLPWQMLAVITMVTTAGHRPVSPTQGEPARMPWGQPAVEQVNANKQSAGWRSRTEKQQLSQSLLIPPSFLKHPHRNARCNHQSVFSLFFPPVFLRLSFISFRASEPGVQHSDNPAPEWANVYN